MSDAESCFEDALDSIATLEEAIDEPGTLRYIEDAKQEVISAERMYGWENEED